MNIESRAHVEDVQVLTSKAREQSIEIVLVIRVRVVLRACAVGQNVEIVHKILIWVQSIKIHLINYLITNPNMSFWRKSIS